MKNSNKKSKKRYGPTPKEYKAANVDKYSGKFPIICRSSLERKAFFSMDNNPAILKWGSESVVIKYFNPVKKRIARYYMDLDFVIKDKSGATVRYLVEIKPESQTHTPIRGKKQEKTYINECCTWAVNLAKWRATKQFCNAKGWRFALWTELGLRIWKEN